MLTREKVNQEQEFIPTHTHSEHILTRYIEALMHLTYEKPALMKNIVNIVSNIVGVSSLLLISSPLTAPIGLISFTVGFLHWFTQQRIYGLPAPAKPNFYRENQFEYGTARASITISAKTLPLLRIRSDNAFDAGYVEGYILGNAIKDNLENTYFLYPSMRLFLGAPGHNEDLKKCLYKILEKIPKRYQTEMLGKVKGYNQWLDDNHHHKSEKLTFERYLLFQLLPDLLNYDPFPQNSFLKNLFYRLNEHIGCTTIALRLGDYTFLTRILDWPAHNVAGKSFLQIQRKIGEAKVTTDIGLPLLSGAATVLNKEGLLIEINVSPGDRVTEPMGMPAFFFNRYCAEKANNVKDIEDLIQHKQPVGPYHLTATDGCDTQSFHFYQDKDVLGGHVIESLKKSGKQDKQDKQSPKLMVVTNNGLKHEEGEPKEVNYCDSNQRKENIYQFFNFHKKRDTFNKLDPNKILKVQKFLLQAARLPLVNNCESVLCAMFVYYKNGLIDARVATDNMYAQNKEFNEFKGLAY